jgi:hypothetical protein
MTTPLHEIMVEQNHEGIKKYILIRNKYNLPPISDDQMNIFKKTVYIFTDEMGEELELNIYKKDYDRCNYLVNKYNSLFKLNYALHIFMTAINKNRLYINDFLTGKIVSIDINKAKFRLILFNLYSLTTNKEISNNCDNFCNYLAST